MGVWANAKQQVGGLVKQAVKRVAQEPFELMKNATGQDKAREESENQGMEAMEQGQQTQQKTMQDDSGQAPGFQTRQDFQKYRDFSGKRDERELSILRKRLFQEYGLNLDLETGMEKARQEYTQKEEERNKVEEQEKQEEEWLEEKKKDEEIVVVAAKNQASVENKAWGAG